jgi:hypothetical protein
LCCPHTFDDKQAKERHKTQYFEIGANRGIYHDGWMASALSFPPWQPVRTGFDPDKQKWELYNIREDFSQANDIAAANTQKLRELQDLWWAQAAKYYVLPLDWRIAERMNAELAGRPSLAGDRKTFTYYPGQVALPGEAAPRILNKSWTLTAAIRRVPGFLAWFTSLCAVMIALDRLEKYKGVPFFLSTAGLVGIILIGHVIQAWREKRARPALREEHERKVIEILSNDPADAEVLAMYRRELEWAAKLRQCPFAVELGDRAHNAPILDDWLRDHWLLRPPSLPL